MKCEWNKTRPSSREAAWRTVVQPVILQLVAERYLFYQLLRAMRSFIMDLCSLPLSLSLCATSLHFIASSILDTDSFEQTSGVPGFLMLFDGCGTASQTLAVFIFCQMDFFAHYLPLPQICLGFCDGPDAS